MDGWPCAGSRGLRWPNPARHGGGPDRAGCRRRHREIPTPRHNATSYPGASPGKLYNSVTRLIEEELNGASGILNFESANDSLGQVGIIANFVPGTDIGMASVDVQNQIVSTACKANSEAEDAMGLVDAQTYIDCMNDERRHYGFLRQSWCL